MKNLVGLLLTFVVGTVYADFEVQDGTYKSNNSNILNFGTEKNSETKQNEYSLFLFSSNLHDNAYLTATADYPIVTNSSLLFAFFRPALERRKLLDTLSSCSIPFISVFSISDSSFLNKETLLIKANESCSRSEKSFDGEYVFSRQDTFIPEKYWGKWGECGIEPAHIAKSDVSADGYYHHGVLGYTINGNTLTVDGFNLDEGDVRRGNISYQFLPNDEVTIKTYWGSKFYRLANCSKVTQKAEIKKKINTTSHQKALFLTSTPSQKQSQRMMRYHPQSGICPCSGYNICIGPRGGRYCITSGGNKRYVK